MTKNYLLDIVQRCIIIPVDFQTNICRYHISGAKKIGTYFYNNSPFLILIALKMFYSDNF